ncbi:MAG: hypothetical protein OES25_12575 [Acidobacteriota bacterium]|nr:hypothetical protein [Acidobacteriota bacterium]
MQSTNLTRRNRDGGDRSIGLPVAFVVSLVFHGLILLVSLWIPFGSAAKPVDEPPDDIVFSFTPVKDESLLRVVDTSDLDVEDSSFDTDTIRASPTPAAEFLPSPTAGGGGGDTAAAETPPEPIVPPQPESEPRSAEQPPDRTVDEELEQSEQPDPEALDESEQDAASTLDEAPDAELLRQLEERRASRPIDFDRALRDFEEQVQAVRERQAPLGPRGKRPSNVFVPDVSVVENTGYGLGNLRFESADYDWEDYGRQVYWAIWRAWHNRILATTDEFELWGRNNGTAILQDEVSIRFTIVESGEVVGISVEAPSSCGPLDFSATDALAEVILPPLPDDFPRAQETVHARFVATADLRFMRRYLRAMKQRGLF